MPDDPNASTRGFLTAEKRPPTPMLGVVVVEDLVDAIVSGQLPSGRLTAARGPAERPVRREPHRDPRVGQAGRGEGAGHHRAGAWHPGAADHLVEHPRPGRPDLPDQARRLPRRARRAQRRPRPARVGDGGRGRPRPDRRPARAARRGPGADARDHGRPGRLPGRRRGVPRDRDGHLRQPAGREHRPDPDGAGPGELALPRGRHRGRVRAHPRRAHRRAHRDHGPGRDCGPGQHERAHPGVLAAASDPRREARARSTPRSGSDRSGTPRSTSASPRAPARSCCRPRGRPRRRPRGGSTAPARPPRPPHEG